MPNNECIPVFEPADRVGGQVTAAGGARGKRFAAVSADIPGGLYGTGNVQVAECGAGVKPVGVFAYDGAQNDTVPLIMDHSWVPMPAGAAITAGVEVQSDAQGRPIPLASGRPAGLAITAQGTVDSDVLIKLYD